MLSAYALGFINLKPLPIQPFPTMVKQVLPRPLKITEQDLEQLRISGEELQRFIQFRPDLKSHDGLPPREVSDLASFTWRHRSLNACVDPRVLVTPP